MNKDDTDLALQKKKEVIAAAVERVKQKRKQ